jgi:hypothetical protein
LSSGDHEKREVCSKRREEHDCEGALVPVDVAEIAFAAVDVDDVETVGAAVVGMDGMQQAVVAILRVPWSLPL